MGFNSDVGKAYGGLSWHMATRRLLLTIVVRVTAPMMLALILLPAMAARAASPIYRISESGHHLVSSNSDVRRTLPEVDRARQIATVAGVDAMGE